MEEWQGQGGLYQHDLIYYVNINMIAHEKLTCPGQWRSVVGESSPLPHHGSGAPAYYLAKSHG